MYPQYVKTAKQEGNQQAGWSFDVASRVEKIHAGFFKKAKEAMKKNKEPNDVSYYVCNVCGNTVENTPPEICPICGAPKKEFFEVV